MKQVESNMGTTNARRRKSYLTIAGNVVFYALIAFILFGTDAKPWILRQLASAGLFRAEINEEVVNPPSGVLTLSYAGIDGNPVSLEAGKGKVIFINFWASWCPPCLAEMPSLDELYQKYKNDNRIVFLFINEDEETEKGKNYLERKGYQIPFMTRTGTVSEELFSGTLPTTVILNKEGAIVMNKEGLADYTSKRFIRELEVLIHSK
jgi:thiol-disulfide isomerase/thioredoxin